MPGLFSTMTVCFQSDASLSAMPRARMSVLLPAEKGTTVFTVCVGQSEPGAACANAPNVQMSTQRLLCSRILPMFIRDPLSRMTSTVYQPYPDELMHVK